MTALDDLKTALSDFESTWDTTMQELDELTSMDPETLDPNNEDRIVELNEELCNLAEWTHAINCAIRREETNDVSD